MLGQAGIERSRPFLGGRCRPLPVLRGRVLAATVTAEESAALACSLRSLGLQPQLTDDADQLLRYFLDERFDLILLDAALPGLPAADAVTLLRTQEAAIPIVLIVAGEAVGAPVPGPGGCTGWLAKPFDTAGLGRVLAAHLRPAQPTGAAGRSEAGELALAGELRQLREGFISRIAETYLQPMQAEVLAADWPAVLRVAHALGGTAGCHGLTALAEAARQLESALKQPAPVDATLAIALLERVAALAAAEVSATGVGA
jgi:DNA-binding response OmpR family regulator